MKYTCTVVLVFWVSTILLAHGDLDGRIKMKTDEIKETPKNAILYLERGILYFQHSEYYKADKDYKKARRLGYKNEILNFRLAENYLHLKKYKKGIKQSQYALEKRPNDVKIHKLRGALFLKNKNFDRAISSFRFVLENATDLRPENFLQLSDTYFTKGDDFIDDALRVIEEGLDHFGTYIFSLKKQQLDYLKHKKDIQGVLKVYDEVLSMSKRTESIYLEKAIFLYESKQLKLANIALKKAKEAYDILHPRLKRTKAMIRLHKKITELEPKT